MSATDWPNVFNAWLPGKGRVENQQFLDLVGHDLSNRDLGVWLQCSTPGGAQSYMKRVGVGVGFLF